MSLAERFEAKYTPEPNSGCWLWTGCRAAFGYGRINAADNGPAQVKNAHRVSWEMNKGEIPDGLCVLHKCDNPACVNPDHLFLGTRRDNVHDMVSKKRNRSGDQRGERHGGRKLSSEDVRDIRKRERSATDYAEHYGVHWRHIYAVWRSEKWQSVAA